MTTAAQRISIVCIAITLLCGPRAGAISIDASSRNRLTTYLDRLADNKEHLAVVVGTRDAILYSRAVGWAAPDRPLTTTALFDVGSITKPLTATAILALEARNRLSLQASLRSFFPGAPGDKAAITVHQLLTHTAGFPPAIGDDYEPLDRAAFLERALRLPLVHSPGSRYEYSNVGYSILAAIVETIEEASFESALARLVLDPAGMTEAGYRRAPLPLQARGFGDGAFREAPAELPWAADGPWWNLRGNGGILASVEDLWRFHRALEARTLLPDSARSRAQQKWVAEDSAAGSHYGYGWALFPTSRGTTLVTHNGGNGTFFADLLRFPSENAVVAVATNRASPNTRRAAAEIARVLFDASYTPRLVPEGERVVEPPEGPRSALLDRLLRALDQGDAAALEALVRSDFSPHLAAMVPMPRHLELLRSIGDRSRGRAVAGVRPSDAEWKVELSGADGSTLTLLVLFDGADSARVGGLGLEE